MQIFGTTATSDGGGEFGRVVVVGVREHLCFSNGL